MIHGPTIEAKIVALFLSMFFHGKSESLYLHGLSPWRSLKLPFSRPDIYLSRKGYELIQEGWKSPTRHLIFLCHQQGLLRKWQSELHCFRLTRGPAYKTGWPIGRPRSCPDEVREQGSSRSGTSWFFEDSPECGKEVKQIRYHSLEP